MNNPLRILHVVTDMGRGGLETMLMNYYRKIDRSKIQFDFLVHREERAAFDDEIEQLGGIIYRLPKLNPWDIKYVNALNFFFAKHKNYTIVHSHIDCMSAIPLYAAKKVGISIRIAHSHSSNQEKNLKYILKLYFKKKIPRVATQMFACGEDAGKWMFGNYPFEIIPNAIDTKKYRYNSQIRFFMREKLNLENKFVIGNVANFSVVKNHEFLIDVFKEVYKMNQNARLVLVGDGPERINIVRKVKTLNLEEQVFFLGVRSDVAEIMQAMDVFVLPSLFEGLPVTMIEAQAAGLPCVISDKVPVECKKTELVWQVPLSNEIENWAEWIITASKEKRGDTLEKIKNAGYDIEENANKLQKLYFCLSGIDNAQWR